MERFPTSVNLFQVVSLRNVPVTNVFFSEDVGVSEWRVVRRRSSAFSEREREETGVPGRDDGVCLSAS